ncbi:MAG: hypothetical protein IPM06_19900 [Rhizobiales bacterium]|nr:hypothetical protein [Hyphomicrobiales bacterium]
MVTIVTVVIAVIAFYAGMVTMAVLMMGSSENEDSAIEPMEETASQN